jgi:hypothetical protein
MNIIANEQQYNKIQTHFLKWSRWFLLVIKIVPNKVRTKFILIFN